MFLFPRLRRPDLRRMTHAIGVKTKKTKKITGLVFDIILAFIFGVTSLPVLAKWAGWEFCWIGFLYIVLHWGPFGGLQKRTKIALILILPCLFVVLFSRTMYQQWRQEKSIAVTGILHSAHRGWKKGYPPNTTNDIEFGQSSVELGVDLPPDKQNQEFLQLFHYARLKIEKGDTGLEFTTTVRDRQGAVVATIEKNRWAVYSPFCLDKNYTKDSLEVKDSRGYVVLQVRILPDRVQLQGEWNDEYGRGMRMIQSCD